MLAPAGRASRNLAPMRELLLALAMIAVLALPSSAVASGTDWLGKRTMNIAHQGGEDEAPSNTMHAYTGQTVEVELSRRAAERIGAHGRSARVRTRAYHAYGSQRAFELTAE